MGSGSDVQCTSGKHAQQRQFLGLVELQPRQHGKRERKDEDIAKRVEGAGGDDQGRVVGTTCACRGRIEGRVRLLPEVLGRVAVICQSWNFQVQSEGLDIPLEEPGKE